MANKWYIRGSNSVEGEAEDMPGPFKSRDEAQDALQDMFVGLIGDGIDLSEVLILKFDRQAGILDYEDIGNNCGYEIFQSDEDPA